MDLATKIESLYTGLNIDQEYKDSILFNPNSITSQLYLVSESRYKLSNRYNSYKYVPYRLTPELLVDLTNNIDVGYKINTELTRYNLDQNIYESDILSRSDINKLAIFEPNDISDQLSNGELTPLGILSFRLKKPFNKEFKTYIEHNFLNRYFSKPPLKNLYIMKSEYTRTYKVDYLDLLDFSESLIKLDKLTIDKINLMIPYIWIWRK